MRRGRLLEGKVAIVTGGGDGIGAAAAKTLAEAGARVTVAARTVKRIEAVALRIRRADGEALAVPTDVSDAGQVKALVRRTVEEFERVDILINCASVIEPVGKVWKVDPADWRKAIEIDLIGVFLISRAVLPYMLRQGSGRLLMVSSPLGETISPRLSAYCSARAGANHFIRILAAELAGSGVTANVVFPGIVETEGLHKFCEAVHGDDKVPLRWKRLARPPDVLALLLLWLCSPSAPSLNGETISATDAAVQYQMARFLRSRASGGVGY